MPEKKELTILERCPITVVFDPVTGRKHFECDCEMPEDRAEMAQILEQEIILHVKPKVAAKD